MLISRPFKFLIGPEETEIVVHEEPIASQSAALNTLMRGSMSESTNGLASWKDVDEKTFVRFAQFAYTGDYSVPQMVVINQVVSNHREEVPVDIQRNPQDSEFEWGAFSSAKKTVKKKGIKHDLTPQETTYTPFKSLTYPLLQPRSKFADSCHPVMIKGSRYHIFESLLSHTSLYVLADKWGVESLKVLTLYKLHENLNMLKLDVEEVPDIVELARYGYSGTPHLETGIDDLRELICRYIAANVDVMSKSKAFTDLIEEGGAFVPDLFKHMLPRIR
jgi:hypothetical protein